MITLNLLKITDTLGKVTGEVGKVTYQALTDDEENDLLCMESDYTYIGIDFKVEMLGDVQIPSIGEED
jgi:hypothetical protein